MQKANFRNFFSRKRRYIAYFFLVTILVTIQFALKAEEINLRSVNVGARSAYTLLEIDYPLDPLFMMTVCFLLCISLSLLYCDAFLQEEKSTSNVTKIQKYGVRRYVWNHYLTAFLLGATFVFLFHLMHTLFTFIHFPALPLVEENIGNYISMFDKDFYRPLFFENFFLYLLIKYIKAALFGGLYAMFSVAICNTTKNLYLGVGLPYIFALLAYISIMLIRFAVHNNFFFFLFAYPQRINLISLISWMPMVLMVLYDIQRQIRKGDRFAKSSI